MSHQVPCLGLFARRGSAALAAALFSLTAALAGPAFARDEREGLGAIDFDISPETAEVYVDGEFIGLADEFDGLPDVLWLAKGTYDVVVFEEGYETLARQISLVPGEIASFAERMHPGEALRPEELGPKTTVRRDERLRRDRERVARAAVYARLRDRERQIGRLVFEVEPEDAAVYLDGEFLGTGEELAYLSDGVVVQPGQHAIEVVRPGYRGETRSVVVALGERVDLEFELHRD